MPLQAHVRRLFPMPTWEEIGVEERRRLVEIDDAAGRLAAVSVRQPIAGLARGLRPPEGRFPELEHELSSHFPIWTGRFDRCSRSMTEWMVLADHHAAMLKSLDADDSGSFIDNITSIAKAVAGVDGLRRHTIGTVPDENGHYVLYPPETVVEQRLSHLFTALQTKREGVRAFEAVLALVWLTHCHPFVDGNGRTSRILFNMILQRDRQTACFYVPLYEMSALSRRGYLLRVREAELYGRWGPLIGFVGTSVALWSKAMSGEHPDTSCCRTQCSIHVMPG